MFFTHKECSKRNRKIGKQAISPSTEMYPTLKGIYISFNGEIVTGVGNKYELHKNRYCA
jgi:hypothetical protein